MLRSAATKVVWVGRATVFLVGLAVILALVVGLASAALGTNGQAWILGQINSATNTTQLNGNVGGKSALLVTNSNKASGSKALHLNVAEGNAPLAVNSSTRVPNLNADKVDGRNATMWAKVAANGEAIASYGVTASSKTPMDGSYRIQFIRDPSRCATTATLAADGQGGDVYASGDILLEPNAVLVETFDSSGIRADRPFSLAVFC